MGSYLSTLTSCATTRTASMTMTMSKIPHHSCSNMEWNSTRCLVTTCSINSFPGNFVEDLFSTAEANDYLLKPNRDFDDRLATAGSSSFVDRGRCDGSSTASTSTSLQRDFDGEGYKEDVDSIVDTVDLMRRDILLTTTSTTTTIITTTDRNSRQTASTRKLERELSTRSSAVRSGNWDSTCDEIISDIFDKIYNIKRPCSGIR